MANNILLNITNNSVSVGTEDKNTNTLTINESWQVCEFYPVGALYFNINNVNPAAYFGGTWERFGQGKVLVGVNENDSDFSTVEYTGTKGEKTHTLTLQEMPQHNHQLGVMSERFKSGTNLTRVRTHGATEITTTAYASTSVGGGAAHNNMMPYMTCYIWKRTA